jgi:hypothetical protein
MPSSELHTSPVFRPFFHRSSLPLSYLVLQGRSVIITGHRPKLPSTKASLRRRCFRHAIASTL